MTLYSAQPRDRIFGKSYGFLPFARNMGKKVGKNINKNLIIKHSQKLLDHATDAFKTASKKRLKKQQKRLVI